MGRISAHRMLSLSDTLHEIQSRTARFLKHNSPPPHMNFKFVPTVILPTPDLVPTKNTTLIHVFTWVAFPADSRATGVSKASLVRSNKWETFLRWTVQVNFLLQQNLQLLHSAVISFSFPFFFFIINGPGYLSQYSDYAYGLGGRVIGGRFREEPKTFFATMP
jgi:hypothetical protein